LKHAIPVHQAAPYFKTNKKTDKTRAHRSHID